jgi:hypothetical protein
MVTSTEVEHVISKIFVFLPGWLFLPPPGLLWRIQFELCFRSPIFLLVTYQLIPHAQLFWPLHGRQRLKLPIYVSERKVPKTLKRMRGERDLKELLRGLFSFMVVHLDVEQPHCLSEQCHAI